MEHARSCYRRMRLVRAEAGYYFVIDQTVTSLQQKEAKEGNKKKGQSED